MYPKTMYAANGWWDEMQIQAAEKTVYSEVQEEQARFFGFITREEFLARPKGQVPEYPKKRGRPRKVS